MMRISVDDVLFADFAPVVGVIVARGVINGPASPAVTALLRDAEAAARECYAGEGSLGADSRLAAWRAAYKQLGAGSYRASAEALIRRARKGEALPSINTLVNLYNVVSVRHALPIGGEDLDALVGDLRLGYATGDEPFVRLGSDEDEPPVPGEVVYADEAGVVCRRWNWREADRTKLTDATANAVLVVDGLAEIGRNAVAAATGELAGLIAAHCGGETVTGVLDADMRALEL